MNNDNRLRSNSSNRRNSRNNSDKNRSTNSSGRVVERRYPASRPVNKPIARNSSSNRNNNQRPARRNDGNNGQSAGPRNSRTAVGLKDQLSASNRRRGRRPVKANWKHDKKSPDRRGEGVSYGKLDLTPKDKYSLKNKPSKGDKLKVIVMGGNEQVGRNMTLIEYGEDIVLIDMGIEFGEEHMRGIDGIVQDFSYLKGKEDRVRAVIITHMHMDHIGSIPYLMPLLPNTPLFGTPVTLALISKKLGYMPHVKVDMRSIDEETEIQLGDMKARFIGVSHSVPDSLAVILETPVGKIVHTGDFKIDLNPQDDDGRRYLEQMQSLGKENILALLADSTNASAPGNQLMEHAVVNDLEEVISKAKGRLLFGLISTNVVRLGQIIHLAEKYGRQVCVGGLSLKTTLEISENLGYIRPQAGTLIDLKEAKHLPPNKVLAIFPGAQGESNAAFYRLADGDLRDMKVVPGDTVVFSSSVIPGNERSVQFITDKFYRLGAKVLNYRMLNLHAGGHAKSDDLRAVVSMVKPKYLIPIEGHHAFLHAHAAAAMETGFPRERIMIADNGQIMEFDKNGQGKLLKKKISLQPIFIDAERLGVVDEDTLRERKLIGDEGVIVIHAKAKGDKVGFIEIDTFAFRKPEVFAPIKQKIIRLIQRDYSANYKDKDFAKKLQKKIERLVEKEAGSLPLISLHI